MRVWVNPFYSVGFADFWVSPPLWIAQYVANSRKPVGKIFIDESSQLWRLKHFPFPYIDVPPRLRGR